MRFASPLLAAALACLALFSSPVIGQDRPQTNLVPIRHETGFLRDAVRRLWKVAEPQQYHKAGVKISCPTSSAGSGIFIANDKNMVVAVTNHHVIAGCENGYVDILAVGGQRTNGRVVWWDQAADVAVIINERSTTSLAVPIYDGSVAPGQTVTVIGFGGPGRMSPDEDIRPFEGRVVKTSYSARLCVDAYTVSGDSGAGILYNGALCGVNWGHYGHPQTSIQGWSAGKPLASNVDGRWLAKTLTQVCRPYGCRPIIRMPIATAPSEPISVAPPSSGVRGERGPAGPAGPPGKDGTDGVVSADQLAAIAKAITSELKNDPSLKGPKGDRGAAGKDGARGIAGAAGKDGKDGRGVEKMMLDPKGNILVVYTDETQHTIGNIYDLQPEPSNSAGPAYYSIERIGD